MTRIYGLLVLLIGLGGPLQAQTDLVITEIFYNVPGSGEDYEFIELHNKGTNPLDVSGYRFTQGVTYVFPANTVIPAGGFYLVGKDSAKLDSVYGRNDFHPYQGGANDGLSNGGEDIAIVDAQGNMVDSVDYDDRAPWPTDPDGNGYSLTLRNPNLDNNLASSWIASRTLATGVVVNGTQYYASPGFIAACLPSFGATIQDTICKNGSLTWKGKTYTSAGTYYDTLSTPNANGCDSIETLELFQLMPTVDVTDTILVAMPNGSQFAYTWLDDQGNNLGSNDTLLVTDTSKTYRVAVSYASKSCADTSAAVKATKPDPGMHESDLIISEIFYSVPGPGEDMEFIELHNRGTSPIDVSGYDFAFGLTYTFPQGTIIPAGGFYLIGVDSAELNLRYARNDFHQFSGALSNGGEFIRLNDANGNLVDSVDYDDNTPWPSSADGGGRSLSLRDVTKGNGNYVNWKATDYYGCVRFNGIMYRSTPGSLTGPMDSCGCSKLSVALTDSMMDVSTLHTQLFSYTFAWVDMNGNTVSTDTSFVPQDTMSYRLVVSFGACSDTSMPLKRSFTTGLDAHSTATLRLFPNPTKDGRVQLEHNLPLGTRFVLRNALGQSVQEGELTEDQALLNLGGEKPGLYFLQLEGVQNTLKIIKH